MRTEEVTYDMAEPAARGQIILWLISFGKKGKLFVRKRTKYRAYLADLDTRTVNCRCKSIELSRRDNRLHTM